MNKRRRNAARKRRNLRRKYVVTYYVQWRLGPMYAAGVHT